MPPPPTDSTRSIFEVNHLARHEQLPASAADSSPVLLARPSALLTGPFGPESSTEGPVSSTGQEREVDSGLLRSK
eukprot:14189929-Alexandrium_andersonii.AAC.1